MLTGKSRAILRKFTISQTSVRILARAGSISGIKKASWLFLAFVVKLVNTTVSSSVAF